LPVVIESDSENRTPQEEEIMSEKKRQKKDGQNKDKKNKAMRESENDRQQTTNSPLKSRDQSNMTETEPGAASYHDKQS
jgi:hypothetical protein